MSINQPPFGEDLRRLGAIASLLKVFAQDSPNMTVRVNQGGFWKNETTWVETPALNTTTLSAPGSGMRYTVICLRENATLAVLNGTAVLSNPALPSIPAGYCPLAAVLIPAGATSIKNDMIFDLRPFFRAGSSTPAHNDTTGRTAADAHPITSITGLQAALDTKVSVGDLTSNLANKADMTGTSDDTFILRQGYVGSPSGNVVLEVERGSSTNVGLRWNESLLTWEYTNDGATWEAFSTPTLLPNSIAYSNLDAGLQSSIDDIAGKADLVHTHVAADVTDFDAAAKAASVDDAINNGVTDMAPSQNAVYDALVAKADLSHTHTASNISDFNTAARSAAVADAITDGVTNIAPSQNAVYDALTLKADATHTHVAADVTDFDSAAQAAVVAQTIFNGQLDTAPSQDAVATALSGKQSTITGAATSVVSSNLTANKAMATDNSGKITVLTNVWDFEIERLQGVTSNVQTQLNGKAASAHTHVANDIVDFDAAAKSAAVADAITNGVTDVAPSQDAVFDALALKSDDGHTHVATDVTDFDSAAKSATISQAITSGETSFAPSENAVFVALSGKSNTGHTHVAADVTDFTTAAQTAAVAQTITNGVTATAPSQDAVYDALVLKQDALGASLTLVGQAVAPPAPAAGNYILYVLSGDGKLYIKDSADVATVVGLQS